MKTAYRIYMVITFGILAMLGGFSALSKQTEYSVNENRYLEKYPAVSIQGILSGDFQETLEEAFSDQFVFRDIWTESSTSVEKLLGYQEISGVYLGKDGYYFEKETQDSLDQQQYIKNLHYVEYLGTQTDAEASLLLVPSAATVLSEKLPENASCYDADSMYQTAENMVTSMQNIDIRTALAELKQEGQIYFKTDHHWTLWGAYAGYQMFCESTELTLRSYESFAPRKVAGDFYGTIYSKVLDADAEPDDVYAAQNIPEVTVESDGEWSQGIYDVQKLKQKDKYAYFFGGNYAKVQIESGKTEKKLLVIKDSFANSMIPFLLEDYGEVTMIDLRYYRDSIKELISQEPYDQVLVLYELGNFAQETNLYKLVQ